MPNAQVAAATWSAVAQLASKSSSSLVAAAATRTMKIRPTDVSGTRPEHDPSKSLHRRLAKARERDQRHEQERDPERMEQALARPSK